jgi:aspartyl-tRNA(Asn)/glutamyl-tRNA(Gln) amidotransferase subunit C
VPIAADDVKHVAVLAGLALSGEEAERFAEELSKIVEYVEMLSEADVEGVEPAVRAIARENPLRPDRVGDTLSSEEVLGNAPESEAGLFRVPGFLPGG